ncbi:hypothetical protein Halha_0290 [Halobacteroides halobius DSM 5150]|uniref:Uncharacterized protein n=1 Tax=Halobacteroides halobius (strain ATCC 35273 / DSM 5150 / MD-1) TaxID=748449 RepID=L0K5N4_HALHC|nr:hypothetical protein [Halobacteroides halobius]AGB40301.1 hypothetical protein Halha_0290 [Halobacteroides halobius DSM 5150]
MNNLQKAMVTLQDNFIREMDKAKEVQHEEISNRLVIERLKERKVKEEMKTGYLDMAKLNLKLATENFRLENKTFFNYEARLAECD